MHSTVIDSTKQRPGRGLVPSLALCSFFVGLDSLVTVPLLPWIAQDAGITFDRASLLVAAYALAYALAAPLFGAWSDTRGRRRTILAGLAVLAAGTALTGTAQGFVALVLFRALTGIGAAMVEPAVFAVVGDRFPYAQRGRIMGIVIGAMIAATLFGVPAGGFLAEYGGWRLTFWLIAAAIAVTLVLAVAGIPEDAPAGSDRRPRLSASLRHLGAALAVPSIQLALLATFLWYGGLQGMFANIGVFYHLHYGLTVGDNGMVIMIAGLGSVLGSLFGGELADRLGKGLVLGCSALVTASALLALSRVTDSLWSAIALHVLWATAFGAGQAALTVLVSQLNPDARGSVLALNSAAMFAGMAAATAASSVLLAGGSFATLGVLCALATLLVLPLVPAMRTSVSHQGGDALTADCRGDG